MMVWFHLLEPTCEGTSPCSIIWVCALPEKIKVGLVIVKKLRDATKAFFFLQEAALKAVHMCINKCIITLINVIISYVPY